jgi:hypothetical protein
MALKRETKQYKISYLTLTILLSALIVYLYTTCQIKEVEINNFYFFAYLVVVFFANIIRKVFFDAIALMYLLFLIIFYFI